VPKEQIHDSYILKQYVLGSHNLAEYTIMRQARPSSTAAAKEAAYAF